MKSFLSNELENFFFSFLFLRELFPTCCTATISFFLCNQFEAWLWCFTIKTFTPLIFLNRVYSVRFHGGKSKFINYLYFVMWKEKNKLTFSISFKVMVWTCHFNPGKVLFKIENENQVLPSGQDGSVSLSEATTWLTSSSSIYFHSPPLFPEYLWVIKEARATTMACSWLYERATHPRKTCIPGNHSFARDPSGERGWLDILAAETKWAGCDRGSCRDLSVWKLTAQVLLTGTSGTKSSACLSLCLCL